MHLPSSQTLTIRLRRRGPFPGQLAESNGFGLQPANRSGGGGGDDDNLLVLKGSTVPACPISERDLSEAGSAHTRP